jgi:hypothetical protein
MKSDFNAYQRIILRKIVELIVTKINLISIKKLELNKIRLKSIPNNANQLNSIKNHIFFILTLFLFISQFFKTSI